MTRSLIRQFMSTRRSAIAVIMAIALVPLILLIGIAVDFTFLSQARTQAAFASQAAAAAATRIAASTYALEISQGNTATNAAKLAVAAGEEAGNDWFAANLGTYVRGSLISGPTTTVTYNGTNGSNGTTAGPPDFTASIQSTTSYPPLFDPLFHSTQNWVFGSNATATTQYSYTQILLMLDTSSSMLIGANSGVNGETENDVLTMEQGTVCPANGTLAAKGNGVNVPLTTNVALNTNYLAGHPTWTNYPVSPTQPVAQDYLYNTNDGDNAYLNSAPNYPGTGPTDYAETCKKVGGLQSGYGTTGIAGVPCALACHYSTTTSPVTGYSEDYYGLARSENVKLRLDVLFSATEQVIEDMESSEPVSGQLSVGVYQFNTDVFPIVNASLGGSGALPEATDNLSQALTLVEKDDWQTNPGETVIPQLINTTNGGAYIAPNSTTASIGGDTNFPLSLQDLEAGNAVPTSSNGNKQPLTATGSGTTAAAPQKFIFIVTDGLEDDSPNNGSSSTQNVMGEMTSITEEAKGKNGNGVCSTLKNTLGYTVYVLYVDYNPVADFSYYGLPGGGGGTRVPNAYTAEDYPAYSSVANTSVQDLTAVEGTNGPTFTTAPIAQALQACASTTSDFYEANSPTQIQMALTSMLKSALASTIRLTN